ncbi:hypothetical protein LUZ60_016536 [Juncus effusus]|nr:hypothetical protein LUZ60_016536 [Juncus effusus]
MSLTQRFKHSPDHNSDRSKLFPTPINLEFPSSSSSLSRLSDSINLLAGAISSADVPSDSSSRDAYLDSTVSILDACNSITAQIERLRLARMKLNFALQLLSSSDTNSMNRATKLLAELDVPLCEKTSDLGSVDELQKVERAVKRLRKEIERGEKMKNVVDETETAIEELMVGLDCLARAVNGLFSVVLNSRNAVLDSYRVGSKGSRININWPESSSSAISDSHLCPASLPFSLARFSLPLSFSRSGSSLLVQGITS